MSTPTNGLPAADRGVARWQLALALASVWILWGSTYIAIKMAVATIPPFLMAGARFSVAGALLYAIARARGGAAPRREHWLPALVCGALLMLGSNGLVSWSETRVSSSVAALIIACVPLWMILADGAFGGRAKPTPRQFAGVVVGMAGVAVLVTPARGLDAPDPLGIAALLFATLSWTAGSLYARRARLPASPLVATALQMMCGGALQLALGTCLGEWTAFDPARVTWSSIAGWCWLMIAGSIVGFTAYVWLLRNTSAAVASSYAFVNPVVALVLGATLGGEIMSPRALIAAGVIVLAVVLVVLEKRKRQSHE